MVRVRERFRRSAEDQILRAISQLSTSLYVDHKHLEDKSSGTRCLLGQVEAASGVSVVAPTAIQMLEHMKTCKYGQDTIMKKYGRSMELVLDSYVGAKDLGLPAIDPRLMLLLVEAEEAIDAIPK